MASDMIRQFNEGKHDEAIQAAVHAIDENPKDSKRYATLATMLISIQDYDQASQLLVQALGLFPNDEELVYDFGLLGYVQGNYKLAIKYFVQLTKKTGTLAADAQYMTALSYQHDSQPQKALAYALTAHETQPNQLDAALLAAQLLTGLGAFQEAKKILAPLLEHKDARVLFAYGMAKSGAGEDGSKYLDEAKKRDPAGYQQQAGQVRDIAGFLKVQDGKPGESDE